MAWYDDAWNVAKDPGGLFKDDASVKANAELRPLRKEQGGLSGDFASAGEAGFGQLGQQGQQQIANLQALQHGQHSVSAEQLRQALQQNQAAQMSMAASARPADAAMAARSATMGAARQGYGLAGQQAVAGLAERNQATQNLNAFLTQQRQLQLQAALGGRQNAINAYGAETQGKNGSDKAAGAVAGLIGAFA